MSELLQHWGADQPWVSNPQLHQLITGIYLLLVIANGELPQVSVVSGGAMSTLAATPSNHLPSPFSNLDLQTSLQVGHTQSYEEKVPGSHLSPSLSILGME
jgi:hypothetical protein